MTSTGEKHVKSSSFYVDFSLLVEIIVSSNRNISTNSNSAKTPVYRKVFNKQICLPRAKAGYFTASKSFSSGGMLSGSNILVSRETYY